MGIFGFAPRWWTAPPPGGKLVGHDIVKGEPRWFGPEGGSGYGSPHVLTIGAVRHIVEMSGPEATYR